AATARDTTTLVHTHLELARLYRSQEVDSAAFHENVRLAASLAFRTNDPLLHAPATHWNGMALADRLNRANKTDLRRWSYAEDALDHFDRAARLYRRNDELVAAARSRSRRGMIYERIGLPDSAIIYAQELLRTVERLDAPGATQKARIRLATGYLIRQDSAGLCTALPLWREALSFARARDLEYDQRLILYNQGVNFWYLERYDSAYAYHWWYTQALEAAAGKEKNAAIAELEVRYATAAKETQINQQAAELGRRRRYQIALVLGLLLLAGGAFSLWRNNRALAAQQRENAVLRQEVDHRVKNNLQVMASLLQLGALREDGRVRTLLETNRRRLLAMGRLHARLVTDQRQPGHVALDHYLEELCAELHQLFPPRIELLTDFTPGVSYDGERAAALGLVLNELVTNALRHGFPAGGPGTVRVSTTTAPGNKLSLTVTDNGVGTVDAAKDGFGTELIVLLVQKLRGTFHAENAAGTTVRVIFPR
ncbi:MAG: sensor histidine kinase, partial [Bacteroidota bacterium]